MTQLNVLDLLEATQVFERRLNLALTYSGLRLAQFRALQILEKCGKMTVSDLSRRINVTRATVSILANELLKAGVIEKQGNSVDKRSFYLRLTETGQQRLLLASQAVAMVEKNLSQLFDAGIIEALNDFSMQIHREDQLPERLKRITE